MNTIELRAAVMPDGMTAETFDPWHCVFVEFKGDKKWQVTDSEQRRLHTITHEWTDAELPHLYRFRTRGEAILAARRHLYTGHIGGKMWSDGEPTPEQLLLDIFKNVTALSIAGNQPRPSEVVDGHRREVEAYLKKMTKDSEMRAYPEEFSKVAILTVSAIDRHMQNIDHDMMTLRTLRYPTEELHKLLVQLFIALDAEGFRYTTMTRHVRRCLPREYMEASNVSTVSGLMTPEQAYLLLDCYEEGIDVEYIAMMPQLDLPKFTKKSVKALREMIETMPDEYLRASLSG